MSVLGSRVESRECSVTTHGQRGGVATERNDAATVGIRPHRRFGSQACEDGDRTTWSPHQARLEHAPTGRQVFVVFACAGSRRRARRCPPETMTRRSRSASEPSRPAAIAEARPFGPFDPMRRRTRVRRSVECEAVGVVTGDVERRDIGALVTGGDYKGLGLVRSLGRRGVRVWVAQRDDRLAGFSRYARRRVHWSAGSDTQQTDGLLRLATEHGLQGWVLFPTDNKVAGVIARNHDALASCYRLTTSPWEQYSRRARQASHVRARRRDRSRGAGDVVHGVARRGRGA